MSRTTHLLKLEMDCEAVILLIGRRLSRLGIRVVRSFDLQSACASFPDLTCPHHGNAPCDCQMVVLLVYAQTGAPASIVVHSHRSQTEVGLVDSPDQKPNPELVESIRMALTGGQSQQAVSLNAISDVSG